MSYTAQWTGNTPAITKGDDFSETFYLYNGSTLTNVTAFSGVQYCVKRALTTATTSVEYITGNCVTAGETTWKVPIGKTNTANLETNRYYYFCLQATDLNSLQFEVASDILFVNHGLL